MILVFAGLLAACGSGDEGRAPAAVSADEARALDEAAAMLEEQRHGDAPPEIAASSGPAPAP